MKFISISHLLLGASLFLTAFTGSSQTPVTKIYTDFNGFWSTDSTARFPNTSHHLLGFRIGSTPNDSIFSTGVNDSLLRAQGMNFIPVNFKAVPISLGNRSGSSYYIGIGSNYNNAWQPPSPSPPYTAPYFRSPEYYLTDGIQGLDIGTAVFNIPAGTNGTSYQIDQFSVSRIGDGIPDIVVTQTGVFSGTADKFRFVDINGNTVGNELSSSFPGSLGVAHWAFYNVSNGYYTSPQPQGTDYIDNNQNPRDIRVLQWDLISFGLNASNVGNVTHFIHQLGGSSDPAFVAYNTSSFRALGNLSPGCGSSVTPPVWLQSGTGIAANASGQISSWKNDGNNTNNGEQSNSAIAPVVQPASFNTNYRPYVHFSGGNILHQLNTPFSSANDSFDIFVVSRATVTTGYQKIVGFKKSGASRNDYASLWLTPSGQLEFRDTTVTLLTSAGTPGISNLGIWHISYTRGGNLSISLNGNQTAVLPGVTLSLPTYHTEYGDNTSAFDLAEIIFYNSNLPAAELRRIHSYLSLKYGIHYTADYMSGTNNTIWKQNNGGYTYNVFGIGREDCIGVLQKQSHSVTSGTLSEDIIQVGLDTIFPSNALNTGNIADAHYIMWGDNNGSLTTLDQVRSREHCLLAPQRRWRAQTTGNLANTMNTLVAIQANGISGPGWVSPSGNPQDYFLLIDRNANGLYNDNVDDAIPASEISNGVLIFKNVLWDTDYSASDLFTVGYKVATPNAGPDQTLAGNSFTLNATPATGTWTVTSTDPVSAAITIQDATQYNTQVTVPNSVTAVLRWEPQGTGSYCYDEVMLINSTPLPIRLESFRAVIQGKGTVLLSWKTASEENNKGFYIERSADGTAFETIGFVKGRNTASSYRFTDSRPFNGVNFYRLKQVDLDEAHFAYSTIEKVDLPAGDAFTVVPNPVTGELTIKGLPLQTPVTIFNAIGQVVYEGPYTAQNISLWPSGFYWIRLIHNGTVESIRFTKQ